MAPCPGAMHVPRRESLQVQGDVCLSINVVREQCGVAGRHGDGGPGDRIPPRCALGPAVAAISFYSPACEASSAA
jgi:hypothetical protein